MNSRIFIKPLAAALLTIASMISNFAISADELDSTFTVEDFRLNSAQELVDVCQVGLDSEHYEMATAFCYGFFEGAVHYDEVIAKLEWYKDLVCPPADVTRKQGVTVFLDYMKENPQYGSEQPVDAIFRSLVDKWPCTQME